MYVCVCVCVCVTLDHKTSLKSLGYICSNSQKYIVWVRGACRISSEGTHSLFFFWGGGGGGYKVNLEERLEHFLFVK